MILIDDIFLIPEDLEESKSIGSLKQTATVRDILLGYAASIDPSLGDLRHHRRSSASIYQAQLRRSMYRKMLSKIRAYQKKEVAFDEMKKYCSEVIRDVYRLVFRKTMTLGAVGALSSTQVSTKDEIKWVHSAAAHELRYLGAFLDDIRYNRLKMPLEKRLRMYVKTLRSIYDSARVMSSPPISLVYWISRLDKTTCPSCRFMSAHSPYLKLDLPTTPRAGQTVCLSNCRCRIVIRPVSPDHILKVSEVSKGRDWYMNALQKIKRTRKWLGAA